MSVDALKRQVASLNAAIKTQNASWRTEVAEKNKQLGFMRASLDVVDSLKEQLAAAEARVAELERPNGTPANTHPEGNDPFADYVDQERSALPLGRLTDDQLANAAWMGYNAPLDIHRALSGDKNYHAPIALMTAVKDRIRWLSRQLLKTTAELAKLKSETP